MPSFAFHPINRITRSISSPKPLPPPPLTKVVSVVSATSTRSRNSSANFSRYSDIHPSSPTSSAPSSALSSQSSVHDLPPQYDHMPRLNPLQIFASITSATPALHHSESYKPPSPVSSSSTSSANDSAPTPPSFTRSISHHASSSPRHNQFKSYHDQQSLRHPTDLPPVSPMSSMYDPHSAGQSPESSTRLSDEHSAASNHSLDGNLFLRPRSTRENRVKTTQLRRPVVTHAPPTRPASQDLGPPVAFRRALFEPLAPQPNHPQTRESAFAGIAARGKAVDDFVANRHSPDQSPIAQEHVQPPLGMPRVMSGKSLEMPRGRLEQLPPPRPATPLHVPRPETPSRLPRPRVFINPSPSRHSIVDPVAVTYDLDMGYGEAEFITREIPRPSTPSPAMLAHNRDSLGSSNQASHFKEDFYFSDEEQVEDDTSVCHLDQLNNGAATPSNMLQYKVRRAVSALRSISFQSHNPDDIESAWGQANVPDPVRERSNGSAASNRWRRACGRISSKNGVQEYDFGSEADAHSLSSYHSTTSMQRDRGTSSRDQLRGVIGVPLRGDHGSRHRRSLWTGGKRDRQMAPQTRAAELLLSNGHGLLAASADAYGQSSALTAVPPMQTTDVYDRASTKRGSVDKYVEFVHASARREAKNKSQYRTLKSRFVNRVFRRRWS